MKAFEWANASSVDDAVKLLKPADPKADPDEMPRPMGGGQDLLTSLKAYIVRPPRVVNLKTIQGLDRIEPDGKGGFKIGALTTIVQIEEHADIKAKFPGLAEAAHSVATPQMRNLATIGGNLCQRPRCWYFRLENFNCRKKGGDTCFAATGENKYNAIFGGGQSKRSSVRSGADADRTGRYGQHRRPGRQAHDPAGKLLRAAVEGCPP